MMYQNGFFSYFKSIEKFKFAALENESSYVRTELKIVFFWPFLIEYINYDLFEVLILDLIEKRYPEYIYRTV